MPHTLGGIEGMALKMILPHVCHMYFKGKAGKLIGLRREIAQLEGVFVLSGYLSWFW